MKKYKGIQKKSLQEETLWKERSPIEQNQAYKALKNKKKIYKIKVLSWRKYSVQPHWTQLLITRIALKMNLWLVHIC